MFRCNSLASVQIWKGIRNWYYFGAVSKGEIMGYIEELGKKAVQAKGKIASASTDEKNAVLVKIAEVLRNHTEKILQENDKDIASARENGITETMVDRLRLTEERIEGIADACIQLVNLEDPVGEILEGSVRPNGMRITKVRVPLGVAGIIYESRPNVTVDAAALCIKSGNAAILRGGKEAIHSNMVLMELMQQALKECGFAGETVQLVGDTSREVAAEMMRANDYIDVLIPRGGAGLIQAIVKNATVPVIETGTGNCHLYVDETAELSMAVSIADNGKTQRPSVCNALETCLVHQSAAKEFLPMLAEAFEAHQVEIRGCDRTREILGAGVMLATEEDYATEFLDYIMSVKVVDSIEEAIEHIRKYSTGHSECIVTSNYSHAEQFQKEVDSACVYVNCSTRFTDGGEFGLGAEIGISTQKLHVRGPMGLRELTTQKYLINGNGQIR
jgi:glutamate-5-semialdehyde dehydrogenase